MSATTAGKPNLLRGLIKFHFHHELYSLNSGEWRKKTDSFFFERLTDHNQ